MVMGVCARVLRNQHDAEDAFQATFLVLVRKARSIVPRDMVGNWLHGVAYRTAMKARTAIAKRRAKERRALPAASRSAEAIWQDVQPLLDQELDRLPQKYRLPILLCDLGGKTWKEASRQLNWPEGTLATRLTRGRRLLAKRLRRRGVTLGLGAWTALAAAHATRAAVPPALLFPTIEAGLLLAAGKTAARVVSANVITLMEGVLRSMGALLLSLTGTTGILATAGLAADEPVAPAREQPRKPPPAPGRRALDTIQGTWALQSVERDGRRLPMERGSVRLAITNRFFIWQEGGEDRAFVYKVPSPSALDLTPLAEGQEQGKIIHGIYRLDGEGLCVCESSGARPSHFTAESGSGHTVFVYRRVAAHPDPAQTGTRGKAETATDTNWADELFPVTFHDFGTVMPQEPLKHRFTFKNTLKQPLQITSVRLSCACAMAGHSVNALKDGQSGWIDITLDPRRFRGLKTVSVYVTAALGAQHTATATLRLRVCVRDGAVRLGGTAEPDSAVLTMTTRTFRIPFQIEENQKKQIKAVALFVSRDQGTSWNLIAEETAAQDSFNFTAEQDGVYWFTVRLSRKDGSREPPPEAMLQPQLKVLISTQ